MIRGSREIQLLWLGRAHTGGDIVVYLPQEGVLCTGDLLASDMSNAYVNEYPDTLERVKSLDFVDVIPAHGEPLKGKDRFTALQTHMRNLWREVKTFHDQGVSATEATGAA